MLPDFDVLAVLFIMSAFLRNKLRCRILPGMIEWVVIHGVAERDAMAKREEQKAASRQKLLESAAHCFAKKGFDGCSIADIAAEAEMSQGSVYVHFANKEDLFKCMIQQEHGDAAAIMRRAAAEAPSFQRIMDLLIKCIRDVGFPIDHRLWVEILAVSARNDSIRMAFLASDRMMRDAFVELIRKAAQLGEVDKNLDYEAVSIWVYALVDGLIARAADDADFDFDTQIATFDFLVRRALGAPPGGAKRK